MIPPLVRELLTWVSERPRTYEETMQAWRSSCPRHTIWEDACMDGFIEAIDDGDGTNSAKVVLTARGEAAIRNSGAADE
jgi:hypothetical protein